MLKTVREHEPQALGEYIACKWCGAQMLDGMDATCIVRHVEVPSGAMSPMSQPAADDFDAIRKRLEELRAERGGTVE